MSMKGYSLQKKLREISQIPPLPASIERVLSAMRDPSISAQHITEMIYHDVAMSSKILRVVNSSYYGYRGKIVSITHAIVILGFNAVRNLILGLSMYPLLERVGHNIDVRPFWLHCIAVASASKVIAEREGQENREEFFTYGLLHDVGKLVMLALAPDLFLSLVREAKQKEKSFYQVEKERVEFPHTSLGYELFMYWKMPEEVLEVVGFHHDKDFIKRKEIIRCVYWADQLVRAMGIGDGGDGNVVDVELEEIFGKEVEDLKVRVYQELERAKVFMEFLRGK